MDYVVMAIVLMTQFGLGWVLGWGSPEKIHKYFRYAMYYWPWYTYILFLPPSIYSLLATCLWSNLFYTMGYNFGRKAENKLCDAYSDAGVWIGHFNKNWLNLTWLIGSLILGIIFSLIAKT